ncbi:MAG: hypothetical protein LBU64_10815 [Planctomycetota bacterium]|nr:hypothetical protein [Planctomycetota bacterium]
MSDNFSHLRPFKMLRKLEKKSEDVWALIDGAVLARLEQKNPRVRWPSWCFLPFSHWEGILKYAEKEKMLSQLSFRDTLQYSGLGTWRYFQGYYDFDEDVYNELISAPIDENIPASILMNLPETCIYVNTPWGIQFLSLPIYGFWVYAHHNVELRNLYESELLFTLDDQKKSFAVALFPLGNWSIKESKNLYISLNAQCTSEAVGKARTEYPGDLLKSAYESSLLFVMSVLPLLAYLCADNRELLNDEYGLSRPPPPDHLLPAPGKLNISPPDPKIWNVGLQAGKTMREAQNAVKNAKPANKPGMDKSRWKYYPRGTPGTDREFGLEWLPPGGPPSGCC